MTEFAKYPHGTFNWVDLGTTNAEAAKAFYTELFGWAANDTPAGPDMVYTMFHIGDKPVAALYQMGEETQSQGVPPHWMTYISVDSADEITPKAVALGGTVLNEPFDVLEAGRMALCQDPTGATFAVWQPKDHIGAKLANEPGTLCWNELATRDREKANSFYCELFGWESDTQDMGEMRYTSFKNGDRYIGGMLQMTEAWGEAPPHWMTYFAVADCDQSAEKVKALGGRVKVEPRDIPQVGRFAVVQDPQGAVFSIIRPQNPA